MKEVKYYKRIGKTTEGSNPVIQGWIYPETYKYSDLLGDLITISDSNFKYWQEVTKEEYIQQALDKATMYVGCTWRSLINSSRVIVHPVDDKIEHDFNYVYVGSRAVLNLYTCEWAEIVSKPEEDNEVVEILSLTKSRIKELSEIPEARKKLENWGVIERDYVVELFGITDGEDALSDVINDTHEPYCNIPTRDICRYIVEGFERDNK